MAISMPAEIQRKFSEIAFILTHKKTAPEDLFPVQYFCDAVMQ